MKIIAHRGFWLNISEQNSEVAFKRALNNDFGIETDVRDFGRSLVISHDIPSENSMTLDFFLELCQSTPQHVLALNVKSDGLQSLLIQKKINSAHFFFDMSVPDMLGYKHSNLNFYTRYSDIEKSPSLYDDSRGIWFDNFHNEYLDTAALLKFISDEKQVVLVSPELHKRSEVHYWASLKGILDAYPQYSNQLGLCTDFPKKAREYFNGE